MTQSVELGERLINILPKLRLYARKLVGDPARADDLVSTVTMKILDSDLQPDSNFNFDGYCMRTLQNTSKDAYKSAFAQHESLDQKADETGFDWSDSDSQNPERLSIADDLMAVLIQLSEDCQEVLTRLGMGFSYAEIAEDIGMEKSTVGVKALRCRKELLEVGGHLLER